MMRLIQIGYFLEKTWTLKQKTLERGIELQKTCKEGCQKTGGEADHEARDTEDRVKEEEITDLRRG